MSTVAILALCIQAYLIQNAFSACVAPAAIAGSGIAGCASLAGPYGYGAGLTGASCTGAYGGASVGNVAVTGTLPVRGAAVIAGQVPVIGAVEFGGPICAEGVISITGSCGGCSYGSPGIC